MLETCSQHYPAPVHESRERRESLRRRSGGARGQTGVDPTWGSTASAVFADARLARAINRCAAISAKWLAHASSSPCRRCLINASRHTVENSHAARTPSSGQSSCIAAEHTTPEKLRLLKPMRMLGHAWWMGQDRPDPIKAPFVARPKHGFRPVGMRDDKAEFHADDTRAE